MVLRYVAHTGVSMTEYFCYVRGCRQETTIGRRHKAYGLVVCCPGHDPTKHAYDAPFVTAHSVPAEAPIVRPESSQTGGTRVARPVVPTRPIAPAGIVDPF